MVACFAHGSRPLREVSTMMRTVTSAVAFSVYVGFLVWMSVLATQTDPARYGMGPGFSSITHNKAQLNEENGGGSLR